MAGVEDDAPGRQPGRAGQGQLAGAGDLAADPESVEQAQDGNERTGLHGEGVQHGLAGRGHLVEGGAEVAGRVPDPLEVEQSGQRLVVGERVPGQQRAHGQVASGRQNHASSQTRPAHGRCTGGSRPPGPG